MKRVVAYILLFLAVSASLTSISSSSARQIGLAPPADADFSSLLNEMNFSAVYEHVKFFASQGSRISGYPGCDIAARYIYDYFSRVGLQNVIYDPLNITIPVDKGASLQLLNRTETGFKIYPMEPNFACPVVAQGLVGPISYVGGGELEELDGNIVEGAIVFMDYASMGNWIRAASLGAKAVVFVEPPDGELTTVFDSLSKSTTQIVNMGTTNEVQPFNFPRLYMSSDDFARLYPIIEEAKRLNRPVYANITASSVWDVREAKNVMGFVEGSSDKNTVIIISSHYDSYSMALSVAPGANDAVGISVLLEIARLLSLPQFKPKYTVLFVAFTGHHQVLQGSRYFFNKYMQAAPRRTELGNRIISQINLQLSTSSDMIGFLNQDKFHGGCFPAYGSWDPIKYRDLVGYITSDLKNAINSRTGKGYKLVSAATGGVTNYYGLYFPKWEPIDDSGVLALNDWAAFGLKTVDNGDYLYSPMDTLDKIDRGNLEANAGMAACAVYGYMQTDGLVTFLSVFRRLEFTHTYKGKVAVYDPTTNWYNGKKALLFHWADYWQRPAVLFTQEDGTFTAPVLPMERGWDNNLWHRFSAFVIDNSTGNIEYAPTYGVHRWAERFQAINPNDAGKYIAAHPHDLGFLAIFKCGTAVVLDVLYPYELSTRVSVNVAPIRWDSWTSPEDYYIQARGSVAVVSFPPDVPMGFLLNSPVESYPMGILGNTTKDNPDGYGYIFKSGQQITFHGSQLLDAYDIQSLSAKYVGDLEALEVSGTEEITRLRAEARMSIQKANEALSSLSYTGVYLNSIDAWVAAREAYVLARSASVDIISVLPFFAFLLIPFVFLFERLLFHVESGKIRLILLIVLFFAFDAFLAYMHPSFRLASNPTMVVMAFLVVIIISPALYMLISYMAKSLKRKRIEILGEHVVEVSRSSAAAISFQAGIENLRKRKLRSALTLVTVILIVIGINLFSSLTSISTLRTTSVGGAPPYDGMFIYDPEWTGIGHGVYDYIQAGYGDKVDLAINGWIYTRDRADQTHEVLFSMTYGTKEYRFYVFMALSPREPYWLNSVDFSGRWFQEGETKAIILPSLALSRLGASIGDKVRVLDRDLVVVGSFDGARLETVKEMSGESITPIDFREPYKPHVTGGDVAIIPYDLGESFGPLIASTTVLPKDPGMVKTISAEIMGTLRSIYLISGVGSELTFYALTSVLVTFGWQMQAVPLALAAFMIFNIILGGVKERERDIFIYSSVGLSPLHVAFMFLAESAIYAVVGGIIGYVTSIGMYGVLSLTAVGAPAINYSSLFVVMALGVIMLVTILASIYPAISASKIITPSLERAWKVPSKPKGDLWEIPMPSLITDYREAVGVTRYLEEFLKTHVGRAGKFSVENLQTKAGENLMEIGMLARLAPYEHGVQHQARILLRKDPNLNRWAIILDLQRTGGEYPTWISLVRGFVDDIRKQLLLWNTLSEKAKEKYMT